MEKATEVEISTNIGRAKYVVSFYKGKKHPDGSKFYDIAIFKNKLKMNDFVKSLN